MARILSQTESALGPVRKKRGFWQVKSPWLIFPGLRYLCHRFAPQTGKYKEYSLVALSFPRKEQDRYLVFDAAFLGTDDSWQFITMHLADVAIVPSVSSPQNPWNQWHWLEFVLSFPVSFWELRRLRQEFDSIMRHE